MKLKNKFIYFWREMGMNEHGEMLKSKFMQK